MKIIRVEYWQRGQLIDSQSFTDKDLARLEIAVHNRQYAHLYGVRAIWASMGD